MRLNNCGGVARKTGRLIGRSHFSQEHVCTCGWMGDQTAVADHEQVRAFLFEETYTYEQIAQMSASPIRIESPSIANGFPPQVTDVFRVVARDRDGRSYWLEQREAGVWYLYKFSAGVSLEVYQNQTAFATYPGG